MTEILTTSRTPDILREVGSRFRALRLRQNLRVEDLAVDSGVSERTINRLEAGRSVGTENLVRVLRGLGRLQALDAFIPAPSVSPQAIADLQGKERKRASGPRGSSGTSGVPMPCNPPRRTTSSGVNG